jgi:ketosteroid isomerase-like protein
MTTPEVAAQLVALCREGKFVDAVNTLYADDIVSIEAADYQGLGREMRGKDAVVAKNAGWLRDNDVHSVALEGPFVSPETFAVHYSFEWTRRATGEHVQFGEVAVYTVENGKITREEFLYAV